MSNIPEPVDVVVDKDGLVRLPSGFDACPGEHLKLVRYEALERPGKKRKSVRGIGVSKVDPEAVLFWEDFEVAHGANVTSAEQRYGKAE